MFNPEYLKLVMGTEKQLFFRHTLEKDALVKPTVLYRMHKKPEKKSQQSQNRNRLNSWYSVPSFFLLFLEVMMAYKS